jgi:hypothetical protein
MRKVLQLLVAVAALTTLVAPGAAADDGRRGSRSPQVVPADHVAGSSGGRIVGDWFVENLSRPASASPFGGSVNLCLDVGRRDRVLSPAGGVQDATGLIEMSCTVHVGRPVVMVMFSVDCSTAEDAPFFAETAVEQRRCVRGLLEEYGPRAIELSVDGGPATDIRRPRFLEVSPQRQVVFPPDPVFGADEGPATFVAGAWAAEVRGLRPGAHTVVATTTYADGSTSRFVVHLDVVTGNPAARG